MVAWWHENSYSNPLPSGRVGLRPVVLDDPRTQHAQLPLPTRPPVTLLQRVPLGLDTCGILNT